MTIFTYVIAAYTVVYAAAFAGHMRRGSYLLDAALFAVFWPVAASVATANWLLPPQTKGSVVRDKLPTREEISELFPDDPNFGEISRCYLEGDTRLTALVEASDRLGRWMSAALDDDSVCDEMKADINGWLAALAPFRGEGET